MDKKSRDGKDKVAVVVLNYKGIADTESAIASLTKQTYHGFTIVAVENGSGDDSTAKFKQFEKKYGDKLHTIYNDRNRGFAGGVNSGISWALKEGYDYIALFNNDAIADKNWLTRLVSTIEEHDDYGIVTGLLLLRDGKTIDSTGEQYSQWGLPFPRSRKTKTSTAPPAGEVFGATGGASIYRSSMLREVGIFDDSFFAYYEDVDISFRTLLAGWKIAYTPTAIAYHKQGATSSKMPGFSVYQTFKNLPLLYIKNVPASLLLPIGVRLCMAYFLMFGHAVKKGSGVPALKGWLKSIVLFWITALPARRKIQKNKKADTSYIKSLIWPDLPPDQIGLRKLRRFFIGE